MLKKIFTYILRLYKLTLSWALEVLFGKGCRFTPTCSEYAAQAIDKKGVLKGTILTVARLSRCHPFGSSGYDPVS